VSWPERRLKIRVGVFLAKIRNVGYDLLIDIERSRRSDDGSLDKGEIGLKSLKY
jgi:hypothetical protein